MIFNWLALVFCTKCDEEPFFQGVWNHTFSIVLIIRKIQEEWFQPSGKPITGLVIL